MKVWTSLISHSVTFQFSIPGIRLNLSLSLHNQGVVEQEHLSLVIVQTKDLISPLMNTITESEVYVPIATTCHYSDNV